MAEEQKPTLEISDAAPEAPKSARKPRRRAFKIDDKEALAKWIADTHQLELDNRQDRTDRRLKRRAKLMGWMAGKTWPWPNASNAYLPIMQIANLKVKGTIENSLKSLRPMMQSKAKQRRNMAKQEKIDQVLDYQFFIENMGEQNIDSFTTNFVEDEAVYGFVQYVKEDQSYHDVRRLPAPADAEDFTVWALGALKKLFPDMITQAMTDEDGYEWKITFKDPAKVIRAGTVCFYDSDPGEMEAVIVTTVTAFDGPSIRILDFEDVVFPARAANLQPPSSFNPEGAPWVDIRFRVNLDTIERRRQDFTYDQLTAEDMEVVDADGSAVNTGTTGDEEKDQKDDIEGTAPIFSGKREDRNGIQRFCRLDVDGDGLEEDVIVWILEKTRTLLKVALLSEVYPGVPIRRPIAHTSYIAASNRVLGISNSELVESLQDGMQTALDQHIDWGTLTNMPFGFARAVSGLKAEPIYLEPGVINFLDDPQNDIHFPTMPTKDSTFSINTITLLQQFVEMVEMQSQASYGRVPTGKASAYRTTGTTMSLLAQTDARAEQVLRRAFLFYGDIFEMMHRLNRRFLPAEKEVRLNGVSAEGADAYQTINRDDLNADVDWEFLATLMNTNKQVLSEALFQVMGLVLTPLAFQAGLIDVQGMYKLFEKFGKAKDLDLSEILKRPPDPMPGPKWLAEEVVSMILAGEIPKGGPLENPAEHLQKLTMFLQSDAFGLISNPSQNRIFADWMMQIQGMVAQQQQLLAAAAEFSGAQQQGGQGPGGVMSKMQPPTMGGNQMMNPGEKLDETIGGVQ